MTDVQKTSAKAPAKKPTPAKKPKKPASDDVTLKQLCAELKANPTHARAKLRGAMSDAKAYPALSKHSKGEGWRWQKGSPAIKEVRALLKD
jgi:hypothetical protein